MGSGAAARPLRKTRARRVRKRSDFDRIQQGGERVNTRRFVLILARQPEDNGVCRLGVTASRRIGGAVTRNRAKRLVREAFRATGDLWPGGIDLVVIVRKPLGDIRLPEVVDEWREVTGLLKKRLARLLAGSPAPENNRGRG